ncbi:alpha/beta fold hydrolase [Nocardia jinanensis]|uniref:alpha/beta fold hydrolase n=1 Tax=Nocardia jinanensis TaxID=382504 RepID=UPI001E387774|nr:alpha/beta hydrolase [Nocardia jinanensis]
MVETEFVSEPDQHTQGVPEQIITREGRSLHAMVLPGPPGTTAPTVVFEAGAAATRSSWGLVQPAVGRFARAVVYDRAGLGRSPADPAGRRLDRVAGDLLEVLDHFGPGPFVLVGHSAGGVIARLAASRRPDRITGLVLVDPTDEAADLLFGPVFRRAERVTLAAHGTLARLGLLRRMFRPMLNAVPADVRRDMEREAFAPGVVRTQSIQARTFLDELATWRDDPPDLGAIPTTVISGGRTGDGMNARIRAAANAAHAHRAAVSPAGRHVLAPGSGHYVPITEPELVAAEIRRLTHP